MHIMIRLLPTDFFGLGALKVGGRTWCLQRGLHPYIRFP